jgi:16S rRNA (guanine527-N7)-methyltransferase
MSQDLLNILMAGARELTVDLTDRDTKGLLRYLDLLLQWNERINLTAIRDRRGIIEKHFVDSLAVVPHLPASARTLVDVGSGAGFPGAVIALVRPALAVTLVESNHKKAAFLQTLRRELHLSNVTVRAERMEDVETRFDVAVSRATLDLTEWLRAGSKLVTLDGIVIGMEGQAVPDLPSEAVRHPYQLGDAARAIVVLAVSRST